ncbi:MAG: RagB/SusD family nutrient uptake outer membrane protein, partial [Chitinophagaceae bacterium]|nr:RagB/SusD family nutrient uptake outer membrane protein [Chitinophagaceae bacterium]
QGLEDLVKSAYVPLKWKFEGEQSYSLWNFGLDEFRVGDQFNNVQFNYYNSNLNSNGPDGFVNNLWITHYAGIHRCNLGIEKIAAFDNAGSTKLGTAAQKNLRIAELKVLRAYYYFNLVQQFGGVPVVTEPPKTLRTDFPRGTIADVYGVIMGDLRSAGPSLPWRAPAAEVGRASRAAAYHFLAKAYLTRGSAVTEARGQKSTDMDSAIVFADSVVRFSGHALEANFGNLFSVGYANHTPPRAGTDGAAPVASLSTLNANNASNEIIFAAQFSQNLALAGLNNQTHLFYPTQYDGGIIIPGMARDFFNGRPFRRLRPTDYTMDVFDKVNDSRFFKTFQTVYYRNVPSNAGLPTFTAANAPTPDVIGKPRVGLGDTAALFIVNTPDKPITRADSAAMRYYIIFARYKRINASTPVYTEFSPNKYLTMLKFSDGVRITNTANEARGIRNGLLARMAETYLIIAEAYGRKGDYANALVYVNIIRTRAAYKSGEPKNPHHWMFYGGAFNDLAPTIATNQATATLFTTNAPSEIYPPNVVSTTDRFIHFMLNERTRELCGELFRWEDLARTETFYDRSRLFNADATGIAPHHRLRPIPLPQIISLTKSGQPLTAAEITAYQNPGY